MVFAFAGAGALAHDDLGAAWPYLASGLVALAAAGALGLRERARAARGILLVGCAFLGVGWAERASDLARAKPLARHMEGVRLSGLVVHAEPFGARTRVILEDVRLPGREGPARVRLATYGAPENLLGRRVEGRATVGPFPGPVAPGAYDFRRGAFFDGLDGAGFTYGAPALAAGAPRTSDAAAAVLKARLHLAARAMAVSEKGGGLAAALTTGLRGGVDDDDAEALRASGLAHLLAISGLHMGLVAGGAFFAARLVFAAVPAIALRTSTKKAAAAAAFLAATAYLALSGGAVSTQRAYAMVILGLIAVFADRPVLSLRLVAAAAWAVLLMQPAAALSAGFQMSFAAATALVALFASVRLGGDRREAGLLRRIGAWAATLVIVDLVAGAATGFAAMHHFGRVAAYGLPANILAGPLMAFWILPMGLLASLCAPFGLDAPFFWAMAQGCALVLDVAHGVAGLEGAVRPVTPGTGWSLGLAHLALLWFCLWRGAVRWAAVPAALLAALLWSGVRAPDVVVTENGDVAARLAGVLMMRADDGFDAELLARLYGAHRPDAAIAAWNERAACDERGCVIAFGDRRIALPDGVAAAMEDCRRADVVILTRRYAPRGLKRRCGASLFDRGDLQDKGALGLWLDDDGPPRIRRARALRRPWSRPVFEPL